MGMSSDDPSGSDISALGPRAVRIAASGLGCRREFLPSFSAGRDLSVTPGRGSNDEHTGRLTIPYGRLERDPHGAWPDGLADRLPAAGTARRCPRLLSGN